MKKYFADAILYIAYQIKILFMPHSVNLILKQRVFEIDQTKIL